MNQPVHPPYVDPVTQPPIETWHKLLTGNAESAAIETLDTHGHLRAAARRRLVRTGEQYVLRLNEIARRAGLNIPPQPLLTGDSDQQAIVMTGHQPVVFHSGLTFKYETTEQFAQRQNAICVAVVIDTDEGDCGQFVIPVNAETGDSASSGIPIALLQSESLARGFSLYLDARLKPVNQIQALGHRLGEQLSRLAGQTKADSALTTMDRFARLSEVGATMLEANLITRWMGGIGNSCLELPLSAISAFPEVLLLIAGILIRAPEFADLYNLLLDQFRSENAIRNVANPFPNMSISKDSVELPFWVVDLATRRRDVLRVSRDQDRLQLLADKKLIDTLLPDHEAPATLAKRLESLLLQGVQLVPRGALITAVLRVLLSDVFVHGTGGGKYDRFTDRLIKQWWHEQPTPFVVASASRYLLPEARDRLQKLETLSQQLRELQFNPQRFFGAGIFSRELESQLQDMIAEKELAISRMKAAHGSGESARDTGRHIQQLTNEIKSAVTDEFATRLTDLKHLSDENKAAINCRTYPWFCF